MGRLASAVPLARGVSRFFKIGANRRNLRIRSGHEETDVAPNPQISPIFADYGRGLNAWFAGSRRRSVAGGAGQGEGSGMNSIERPGRGARS